MEKIIEGKHAHDQGGLINKTDSHTEDEADPARADGEEDGHLHAVGPG